MKKILLAEASEMSIATWKEKLVNNVALWHETNHIHPYSVEISDTFFNLIDSDQFTKENLPDFIVIGDELDTYCGELYYDELIDPESDDFIEFNEFVKIPYFPHRLILTIQKICRNNNQKPPKMCILTTGSYYNLASGDRNYKDQLEYCARNNLPYFLKANAHFLHQSVPRGHTPEDFLEHIRNFLTKDEFKITKDFNHDDR